MLRGGVTRGSDWLGTIKVTLSEVYNRSIHVKAQMSRLMFILDPLPFINS